MSAQLPTPHEFRQRLMEFATELLKQGRIWTPIGSHFCDCFGCRMDLARWINDQANQTFDNPQWQELLTSYAKTHEVWHVYQEFAQELNTEAHTRSEEEEDREFGQPHHGHEDEAPQVIEEDESQPEVPGDS